MGSRNHGRAAARIEVEDFHGPVPASGQHEVCGVVLGNTLKPHLLSEGTLPWGSWGSGPVYVPAPRPMQPQVPMELGGLLRTRGRPWGRADLKVKVQELR